MREHHISWRKHTQPFWDKKRLDFGNDTFGAWTFTESMFSLYCPGASWLSFAASGMWGELEPVQRISIKTISTNEAGSSRYCRAIRASGTSNPALALPPFACLVHWSVVSFHDHIAFAAEVWTCVNRSWRPRWQRQKGSIGNPKLSDLAMHVCMCMTFPSRYA